MLSSGWKPIRKFIHPQSIRQSFSCLCRYRCVPYTLLPGIASIASRTASGPIAPFANSPAEYSDKANASCRCSFVLTLQMQLRPPQGTGRQALSSSLQFASYGGAPWIFLCNSLKCLKHSLLRSDNASQVPAPSLLNDSCHRRTA